MAGKHEEVMWPRLVANKILKKRMGSNNFVADFPSNNSEVNLVVAQSSSIPRSNFYQPPTHTLNFFKVFVSTWNVGGIAPNDEELNIEDWVDTSCDIYVFGFQEIVPLKASSVFGLENRKNSTKWNSKIREALNKKLKENFKCIISKQMVGIMISIWVRSDLHPFIRNPNVSCIGCGLMGCLGNKGSVSVRFKLHETSFCFVCTHLASGGKEKDEKSRNSNVSEILYRTTFPKGPSLDLPKTILDHQRVILLGDLNYRVSLPEATTRMLVERKDWNTLLENDELRMEMLDGQVLEGWEEGNIKFEPTYKYYPNSDVYYGAFHHGLKAEKIRRAPAWCDRIIWNGKGLKQVSYNRGESKLSDHRPVMAVFLAEVETLSTLKSLQGFFLSNRFGQINTSTRPLIDVDVDDDDDDDDDDRMFSAIDFNLQKLF